MKENSISLEDIHYQILKLIAEKPRTWKELLELTKLARGTLAKHIKKLLELELIKVSENMEDRRIKIYSISDKGDKILKDLQRKDFENSYRKIESILKSKLPQLSEEEGERINQILRELKELLEL